MAEESLPRRARDTHQRLNDFEKEHQEAHEAFLEHLEERSERFRKTVHQMIVSGEVDAEEITKLSNANDQETAQELKEMRERDAKLLEVAGELEMVRIEASIEGTKLRFDTVKQQATFSAAAVAGVTAVTQGILPEHLKWTWLLWLSLILLLLTIVVSLLLLYIESLHIEVVLGRGEEPSEKTLGSRLRDALYFSALGLPIAIVAYLTFALANLA